MFFFQFASNFTILRITVCQPKYPLPTNRSVRTTDERGKLLKLRQPYGQAQAKKRQDLVFSLSLILLCPSVC
jgi:hypothetical protein